MQKTHDIILSLPISRGLFSTIYVRRFCSFQFKLLSGFQQSLLQSNLSYYHDIYPDIQPTFYYAVFHLTVLNCCPSF